MPSPDHTTARFLSLFTVGYNILEGLVSISIGWLAGSTALVGFGLDSFVESLSGSIMLWRFQHKHRGLSHEEEERIEKKAIRLMAYAFFALGAYVLYESLKKLYLHEAAEPTFWGIVIALVSLVVMPILFLLKYRTGKNLGSRSLVADSKQTLSCVLLSVALLIGLGLNYLFGLWWADPVTGVLIAGWLLYEGYRAKQEEKLCGC